MTNTPSSKGIIDKKAEVLVLLLTAISILALFSSCSTSHIIYQTPEDQEIVLTDVKSMETGDPTIQEGDKITISIFGHEELSIGSLNSSFSSNEATGRWVVVDNEGKVNLPKTGRIKLQGLTTKEANYFLEEAYGEFIKNPIINVRVLNHAVTILGEVNNPGSFSFDNQKKTLIELVGEANGFTDYAKANVIKIQRKVNNENSEIIVDLTGENAVQNANVLLMPGDVVYVEPRKAKQVSKNAQAVVPFTGIVTAIAVIVSLFK